jgi:nucleoside-diphosphate-sugar epimerase
LLGRYLLRDLTLAGFRVVVLARSRRSSSAAERIRELHSFWCDALGTSLPAPVVLEGSLEVPGLGLGLGERSRLGRRMGGVVHSAASVNLRSGSSGEPWTTNVEGTRHLLEVCRGQGLTDFHHISTAFVCGDRPGPICEEDPEGGRKFHNDYERSKWEAELLLRAARDISVTMYRPSVIVGDSTTGYTCTYHAFYRFAELADRLADPHSGCAQTGGKRQLPLRLPFRGDEPRNFVPVDWVSGAITRLVGRAGTRGKNYHLVTDQPISVDHIRAVFEDVLNIEGVEWAGHDGPEDPTALEQLVQERLWEYWPYRHGDPVFSSANTRAALPDYPAPALDPSLLARLVRFAVADNWGRAGRSPAPFQGNSDCAHYLESFFPVAVERSSLGALPLTITLAVEVVGPGGVCRTCRWQDGKLLGVERGLDPTAEVRYRLDGATFARIVQGTQAPQEAFFSRRIEILGNVEKGLKLALLFEQFVRENPYAPGAQEAPHADAVCT